MEEPSVLDYLKSRLFFWREERIQIPQEDLIYQSPVSEEESTIRPESEIKTISPDEIEDKASRQWFLFAPGRGWVIARILLTLGFILLAQSALEPPSRSAVTGFVLYLIAIGWLLWSNLLGDWRLPDQQVEEKTSPSLKFRPAGLFISILLGFVAYLMFGDNSFSISNLFVWILALLTFIYAFWLPDSLTAPWWMVLRTNWSRFVSQGISFSPWTLVVIVVFGFSVYFRFYLLEQVPAEMISDHAEKLLDIQDVLNGQTSIYFQRNTGREAFQMYLTAMIARVFDTGLSFLSLKIGTAICGLLTLPFIYLLGKEIANRKAGLFAMFFAGIAYWPNVISRIGLRFTLYPTFTAPMFYFLLRGLRQRKWNDFILSGIFLGLGLHGYSSFRIVPILVVVTVVMFILHHQSKGARGFAVSGLLVMASTSFMFFLPLLRFLISNPTIFSYRMMTRIGQIERAYPGPPAQIFFENLRKAITMLVWDNGHIWAHSIPNRPALGIVSAAFTVIGVVLLIVRYIKKKNWLDITLLVSIPLLMLPSILSLAFPEENPSLNRTSGALIVVFLIVGLAFDSLLTTIKSNRLSQGGKWLAWAVAAVLLTWSASQNFDIVFNQYAQQIKTNTWNTKELGAVIRQYADTYGAEDSAWVIGYPHWVDTRLVGIWAGYPERDYALWPENIIDTMDDPRAKLYLVKPEDTATINLLKMYYSTGVLRLYESQVAGRDFYMYSVPPKE